MAEALARAGVPSDREIVVNGRRFVFEDALRAYAVNLDADGQTEWVIALLAHYADGRGVWRTKYGQRVSLGILCDRLLASDHGSRACHGAHVYYAATLVLSANARSSVISDRTANALKAFVDDEVRRLRSTQNAEGLFPVPVASNRRAAGAATAFGYSSHTLEWLVLASAHVEVDDGMMERCAMRLLQEMLDYHDDQLRLNLCPVCHALSALSLLWKANAASTEAAP